MEEKKEVIQNFDEVLQKAIEARVANDKEAFKDATAGTRVISETSGLLDEEYAHLEELVDKNSVLKRMKNRLKTSFSVVVIFTVFVAVARFVAFTQGY